MTETYLIQQTDQGFRNVAVTFSAFLDGDTHCAIAEVQKIQRARVLVVHPLYPNQNEQLIRLVLLMDLLHDLDVLEISVFCPYLPYSRQDKRHLDGEAVSMNSICRMLSAAGCSSLYVVDCHFMRSISENVFCGLRIINISATKLLIKLCRDKYLAGKTFHIIGPDKGASLLGAGAASQYMHKTRGNYIDGSIRSRNIIGQSAEHISLIHQTVVVVDDIISSGTTMLGAIETLRNKGSSAVYCVVTHGLFLGDSFAKLADITDGILAGDTIQNPAEQPITVKLLNSKVLPHWIAQNP